MSISILQPAALACLLGALVLGLRRGDPPEADTATGDSTDESTSGAHVAARLARWYDRSSSGARLASRLWSAQLGFTPTAWRSAQLLVAIPLATLIVALGTTPGVAAGVAISIVRGGAAFLLWLRRDCARDAVDAAAPLVARALSAGLSTSGSGTLAVARAAARCTTSPTHGARAAARVLESAAARVALGGDAGGALQRAVQDASPGALGISAAAVVADIFVLHHHDAVATATALDRLAGALEDDRAVRREARAAVGDVRMSAVAVPVIAAVTGAVLLTSDPPALAAALSTPLLPLLVAATVVVGLAVVWVRRLVTI